MEPQQRPVADTSGTAGDDARAGRTDRADRSGSSKHRGRPRPTARGIALGSLGLIALIGACLTGRIDLLFVGLAFLLLPLAAMIALVLDRPFIAVERSVSPSPATAGQEIAVRVRLRNRSARSTPSLQWWDAVPSSLGSASWQSLPALAGIQEIGTQEARADTGASVDYRLKASRRGLHEIGPLLLRRLDPFGLARAEYTAGGVTPVLVIPRLLDLDPGPFDGGRSEGAEFQRQTRHAPSVEDVAVRDYRAGDPMRRVHWRATARHGELMVRNEEPASAPEVRILLDCRRSTWTAPGRFEDAVDMTSTLAVLAVRAGFTVTLVGTISRSDADAPGQPGEAVRYEGSASLAALLDRLATIEASGESQDFFPQPERSGHGGQPVSVFAVVGVEAGKTDEIFDELNPHRAASRTAVAVVFETSSVVRMRDVTEVPRRAAGWSVVTVPSSVDPAEAWRAANSTASRNGQERSRW